MTPPAEFELLLLDYGGVCTPSHGEYVASTQPLADVRPECLDVVGAALSAGITVAVLSNELVTDWIDGNPLLDSVDHVISCADNRIFKPDRRAYARALLVTGCEAGRTLYVDDEPDNVAGARGAGLTAILFDAAAPAECWAEIGTRIGVRSGG